MKIKIGIIGAGLAGLACGYELFKRGYEEITILEKEKVVGGRTVSEIHEGYRINLGAVLMTPLLDKTFVKYLKEFDLMSEIEGPSISSGKLALIYKDRLMKLTKFSIMTSGVFAFSDLVKLSKLQKYFRKINFNCDYFDPEQERNHRITTANFFRERGFSEEFLERFVQPFTSCYAPADELSAAYGLRLFAAGFTENKKPKNGMDVVARAFHEKLGKIVATEASVAEVTRKDSGMYTLEYIRNGKPQSVDVDVVKGRLREKFKPFLGIFITRVENPSNVYFIYIGEEDARVSYVHLYEKNCDLSPFYEDYQIIKEVYKYPAIGAPRPGIKIPDLETKIENVYICGDFYRYPCVESALVSGIRVADLIYCKYPTRGYTRL